MRPNNLHTRIFSDSGDPEVTKELISTLGFLDGQTTNPSLIAKNPEAEKRLSEGKKFSDVELLEFYKEVVVQASKLIPNGSISIEVYADESTTAAEMLAQGRKFFTWIPNAHIKYPTTKEGLKATEMSVKEGMRVNMTLVFSQAQAAAVHAATRLTSSGQAPKRGDVFLSPFIGRLDDLGQNGMDLIANVIKMYSNSSQSRPYKGGEGRGRSHVEVLTASVRNMDHFMYALKLGSDIITAPPKILLQWAEEGMKLPEEDYVYNAKELKPIPYEEYDLNKNWDSFDASHPLTTKGIAKFSEDWNSLIKK